MRKNIWLFPLAILGLLVLAQGWIILYDASGFQAKRQYERIKAELQKPVVSFGAIGLSNEQGIIALSYIAEGLVEYAQRHPAEKGQIVGLLEKEIQVLLSPSVCPMENIEDTIKWAGDGLYLSHLNIVLGAYQKISSNNRHLDLSRRISGYLALGILESPFKNQKSYASSDDLWPADNAASLYSIFLFDQNNNTQISREPVRQWLRFMAEKGTDPKTGLPFSELTGIENYSRCPRGCALSWTVKYMGKFAPAEAKHLWKTYNKHFKENFLITCGFREYPDGIALGEDADSGPIVFGVGAAATGIALPAAKNVGDFITYWQLNNSLMVANLSYFLNQSVWQTANNLLALSIRFSSAR